MTHNFRKLLAGLAALAALALGGAALAAATSGEDPAEKGDSEGSASIDSTTAARARRAAVAETGGEPGHVERDGEKGATYEVEVTKPDGSQVDVRLDERFEVVAVDSDSED
jgi:uncharacterized membrane protein YkoI